MTLQKHALLVAGIVVAIILLDTLILVTLKQSYDSLFMIVSAALIIQFGMKLYKEKTSKQIRNERIVVLIGSIITLIFFTIRFFSFRLGM